MNKARVLYVDNNYNRFAGMEGSSRIVQNGNKIVREMERGIASKYNLISMRDLSQSVINTILEIMPVHPIDAMVTHIPYARGVPLKDLYTESTRLLRGLREAYPSLPIIGFTGAEQKRIDTFVSQEIIDEGVRKTDSTEENVRRVMDALERRLKSSN